MTKSIAQQYAEALTEKSARETAQQQLEGKKYSAYAKPYIYDVQSGQKFDKIVQHREGDIYGGSVHAFVERSTGKLIKAAGWKAPAKDKNGLAYRYDLSTPEGFLEALYNATFSGGYLYADYVVIAPSREAYEAAGLEYPWADESGIDMRAEV